MQENGQQENQFPFLVHGRAKHETSKSNLQFSRGQFALNPIPPDRLVPGVTNDRLMQCSARYFLTSKFKESSRRVPPKSLYRNSSICPPWKSRLSSRVFFSRKWIITCRAVGLGALAAQKTLFDASIEFAPENRLLARKLRYEAEEAWEGRKEGRKRRAIQLFQKKLSVSGLSRRQEDCP